MTITQYELNRRAAESAKEIVEQHASFDDAKKLNTYEAWESYIEALDDIDIYDMAHAEADSWDWAIYYHYAHEICQNCDRDEAEQTIEDSGGFTGDNVSYDAIAAQIAYWVIQIAVARALEQEIEGCRELATALQENTPEGEEV